MLAIAWLYPLVPLVLYMCVGQSSLMMCGLLKMITGVVVLFYADGCMYNFFGMMGVGWMVILSSTGVVVVFIGGKLLPFEFILILPQVLPVRLLVFLDFLKLFFFYHPLWWCNLLLHPQWCC